MRYETKYAIGQKVYLKLEKEQIERLIIEIRITPGNVIYGVTDGINTSEHYDIELSLNRDDVKALT